MTCAILTAVLCTAGDMRPIRAVQLAPLSQEILLPRPLLPQSWAPASARLPMAFVFNNFFHSGITYLFLLMLT